MTPGTATTRRGIRALLGSPRFEVMPFESFDEQISHLPETATVTITASPQKDIEETIDRAEDAAERGYTAVPHVAARYVRDPTHLEEIAERLTDAGITDIFVPGGDREEPLGEFESAYQLLSALDDLGYAFDDVGITGYPEGHPFLSERTLVESMKRKRPYASYVSTQICFDPETILTWIERLRRQGVDLPIHVGVPGVLKYQRLLAISRKVGVGDSIRFLHKTSGLVGFLRRVVGSRGKYSPDDIVEGLAPHHDDPAYGIEGIHIYTFNQVPDTEAWRRERLGDLERDT